MTPHDSTRCACGEVATMQTSEGYTICDRCFTIGSRTSEAVGAVDAEEQTLDQAFTILGNALHVAKGEGFVEQFDTLRVVGANIDHLREQVATLTAERDEAVNEMRVSGELWVKSEAALARATPAEGEAVRWGLSLDDRIAAEDAQCGENCGACVNTCGDAPAGLPFRLAVIRRDLVQALRFASTDQAVAQLDEQASRLGIAPCGDAESVMSFHLRIVDAVIAELLTTPPRSTRDIARALLGEGWLADSLDTPEKLRDHFVEYGRQSAPPRSPATVTELQVQLAATALIAEVFVLTQPADGDVFSWVDDHREQIARAALAAILTGARDAE